MATASLVADSQAVTESKDTTTFTEMYSVVDLVDPDDRVKLYEALSATGLPVLGDPHPALAEAVCVDRQVEVFGVSTAKVECRFEIPTRDSDNALLDSTGVPRFNSGLTSETTSEDRLGNLMILSYSGTLGSIFPDSPLPGTGLAHAEIKETQLQKPTFGFSLDIRTLNLVTTTQLAVDYTGYINSVQWNGSVNFAPRTILCTGVDLDVVAEGEYRASYNFEYRPETWDFKPIIRIHERIPSDAGPGNGQDTFEIYPSRDFNLLPVNL